MPPTGAFRQYDAADPGNRLVAAEREVRWHRASSHVAEIESRIAAHDGRGSANINPAPADIVTVADNLRAAWSAPTTDAHLKKRIVRAVIEEMLADLNEVDRQDRSLDPKGPRRAYGTASAEVACPDRVVHAQS